MGTRDKQERPMRGPGADRLADDYAQALMSVDAHPAHATDLLRKALDEGTDPLTIYVDVIPAALRAVGRCWERGEISVAAEHLATTTVQATLRELSGWLERRGHCWRKAVIASVEDEGHDLGARILADLLGADGWEVLFVGAATPTDALTWLVRERRPDAVLLSATLATSLPRLREAVAALRGLGSERPHVMVGGQACANAADLARKIGADACELRADQAVVRLRRLPGRTHEVAVDIESLSSREQEILRLLSEGLTNPEIAKQLGISVPTVKTHVRHVLDKLSLRNRAQAAVAVARHDASTRPGVPS